MCVCVCAHAPLLCYITLFHISYTSYFRPLRLTSEARQIEDAGESEVWQTSRRKEAGRESERERDEGRTTGSWKEARQAGKKRWADRKPRARKRLGKSSHPVARSICGAKFRTCTTQGRRMKSFLAVFTVTGSGPDETGKLLEPECYHLNENVI